MTLITAPDSSPPAGPGYGNGQGRVEPDLSKIHAAIARVRMRLRLQAALIFGVFGLLLGSGGLLVALFLRRLGVFSLSTSRLLLGAGLVVAGAVAVGALRRILPLQVAARIDQTHSFADRLSSALELSAQLSKKSQPPRAGAVPIELGPETAALAELAIADAARAAHRVTPAVAAPFPKLQRLPLLLALIVANLLVVWVRLPSRSKPTDAAKKPAAAQAPRLIVEKELLAPEHDELMRLAKEAAAAGDKELEQILKEMEQLLAQVERGEISRKEAFDRLAELEERLKNARPGVLEEMKEKLRKAGTELGEAKLAKDLGKALTKEDLDKAQKELKKLADQALRKNASPADKQALAKAMERAAEALKDKAPDKDAKREDPKDPSKQKDEWKQQSKQEELSKKMQELQEEEQRLKKRLKENPNDQEAEERLKKNRRELEQLKREQQERDEARRETEQLQKDLKEAAEELRKQMERMSPEQRRAMEKLAEDLRRMQQQMQRGGQGQQQQQQQGQNGQGQNGQSTRQRVTIALGSIKQVLRRVGRSSQGDGQQGQQGQQGQNGQGQNGQGKNGQGQGQNGNSPMKDFLNRASGKGNGQNGEVLVEGEGGEGGEKMMILGEGTESVMIPLPGGGQQDGPNPGQPGGNGGDQAGKGHDPNHMGNPTELNAKHKMTRVYGKEGAGPTRSETILGAAEKGFSNQSYKKVYSDYTAVTEQAMSKERVPPGYRFYVKRYFQMIKPRE